MQKAKHTIHEPYYCHHRTEVTTVTVKSLIPYCDSFYNWKEVIAIKALADKKFQVTIMDVRDSSKGQYISTNKMYTDSSYTQYHNNGVIKFKGEAIDSAKFRYGIDQYMQGFFTYYDTQGRKLKEERFLESRLHGQYTEYNANGTIRVDANYNEGNKHGKFLYHDSTGKLKKEENYQNDYLHGEYKEYYKNGKLKVKGRYYYDKKDGTWKYYTSTEKLLKSKRYKNKQELWDYLGDPVVDEWVYQDANIERVSLPNPNFDDYIKTGIETFCAKSGITLSEFSDRVDKIFLKLNTEQKLSLVFYKWNKTSNELVVNPNWFGNSYPARLMGASGISYFRVNYRIQSDYH